MKNHHSPNKLTSLVAILLVLALVFAILPVTSAQAAKDKPTCSAYRTVKSGDTLGFIADKYKVRVDDIVKANKLHNPYTIYVGMKLCIPANSKPESSHPDYAKNPAADFKPSISGDKLTIRTSAFPKGATYYVKIGPPNQRNTHYTKIGLLKSGNGGTVNYTYIIPKEFRSQKILGVCLKDVFTDLNICRSANR
jgi:hypothetical protein